jgi:hypothetical protein
MLEHVFNPHSDFIFKATSQFGYTPYMMALYYKNNDIANFLKNKCVAYSSNQSSSKPSLQW